MKAHQFGKSDKMAANEDPSTEDADNNSSDDNDGPATTMKMSEKFKAKVKAKLEASAAGDFFQKNDARLLPSFDKGADAADGEGKLFTPYQNISNSLSAVKCQSPKNSPRAYLRTRFLPRRRADGWSEIRSRFLLRSP